MLQVPGHARWPAQAYEPMGALQTNEKNKKKLWYVFFFRFDGKCWGKVAETNMYEFKGPEKMDKNKGALAACEHAQIAQAEEEQRRRRKVVGEQMVSRSVRVIWNAKEAYDAFVKRQEASPHVHMCSQA